MVKHVKQTVEDPVIEVQKEIKQFFKSRTVWVNIIAFIAFLVQRQWGFVIDEETQVQLLAVINIFLRSVTKDPIRWNTTNKLKKDTTKTSEGV